MALIIHDRGYQERNIKCVLSLPVEANKVDPYLVSGRYIYRQELREMAACRPSVKPWLPAQLQWVLSPLNVEQWGRYLQSYPDREFVALLLASMARDSESIKITAPRDCGQPGATWARRARTRRSSTSTWLQSANLGG